jgi:hypothetical protein
LGRMMVDAGLSVQDVFFATRISHRTLSDYLAYRAQILPGHLVRLCALFECDAEDFVPRCRACGDKGCWECRERDDDDAA